MHSTPKIVKIVHIDGRSNTIIWPTGNLGSHVISRKKVQFNAFLN